MGLLQILHWSVLWSLSFVAHLCYAAQMFPVRAASEYTLSTNATTATLTVVSMPQLKHILQILQHMLCWDPQRLLLS
jgi:hypothetical protein